MTVVQRLTKEQVELQCAVHGTWVDQPKRVRDNMSFSCPQCAASAAASRTQQHVLEGKARFALRWKQRTAKHVQLLSEYVSSYVPIRMRCTKHKLEFEHAPNGLPLAAYLCPQCRAEGKRQSKEAHEQLGGFGSAWTVAKLNTVLERQGNDLRVLEYQGIKIPARTGCITCGATALRHVEKLLYNGKGCRKCTPASRISAPQQQLFDYVKSLCPDAELEVPIRRIDPKAERPFQLDIYVPSVQGALELDGLYWHKTAALGDRAADIRAKNAQRASMLASSNIRLFVITDVEWSSQQEKFKAALRNFLRVPGAQVHYGRKLTLTEVPRPDAKEFFRQHHLQGAPSLSSGAILFGLCNGTTLVAVMAFDRITSTRGLFASKTSSAGNWELIRYAIATDTQIVGGAQRLLKAFVQQHRPSTIVSYSHTQWFSGALYSALGFVKVSVVPPSYRTWWQGQAGIYGLRSKQFSAKANLARLFPEAFSEERTERALLHEQGIPILWDYGKVKWLWTKK